MKDESRNERAEEATAEVLRAASELRDIANAIDELQVTMETELPTGKRELFNVICEGLFTKTHDLAFFLENFAASDLAKVEVR